MIEGTALYAQSISSDVWRFDDLEIVRDTASTIPAVLDRTTLDVEFDHSCLEGLEYQLLVFPADAFTAMCWAEAVDEPAGSSSDHLLHSMHAIRNEVDRSSTSSDESESDTDECCTFNGDAIAPLAIQSCGDTLNACVTKLPRIEMKNHYTSFDASEHFITLEPRFTQLDPAESIGLFPVPNHHSKVKTTRIATLRTYLPLRRKKITRTT